MIRTIIKLRNFDGIHGANVHDTRWCFLSYADTWNRKSDQIIDRNFPLAQKTSAQIRLNEIDWKSN